MLPVKIQKGAFAQMFARLAGDKHSKAQNFDDNKIL